MRKCEMPECVGDGTEEVVAARGPSDNLIQICQACLNDGWSANVEVLE